MGTEQFEIEWFLGGDWKFLACICGLGAAHAMYPCIWCKSSLYDKYDGRKKWSLTDVSKGACSIEEIQQQVNTRSKTVEKYNSNQRGLDSLKQIVQKRNRMEYLEDLGCQRGTRSVTCGNCNLGGHNIKTCLSPCSSCAFKPCCSPLHQCSS